MYTLNERFIQEYFVSNSLHTAYYFRLHINVDQYVCKGYKGFMHSRKQSRTINQQTQKQCNLRMHKDSCKGKILRAL